MSISPSALEQVPESRIPSQQSATKDYGSRLGDREIHRRYFHGAFESGYRDGYCGLLTKPKLNSAAHFCGIDEKDRRSAPVLFYVTR